MLKRAWLNNFRHFDWALLLSVLILSIFGLAGIGSVGLSREPADFIFLRKQIFFFILGLVLIFIFGFTHPTRWRFAAKILYIISVASLMAVLVFGLTVRGVTGWFEIFGVRIQPVEAAKFTLILVLAKFIAEHMTLLRQWSIFSRTGLLLLPPLLLVLLQPDAGSASVLFVLWFALVVSAGVKRSHFIIVAGALALFIVFAWFFILAPYQKERVLTFVNPNRDPLGSGYNVTQSLIAVGSGKMFGRGLGFGAQSQLKFLPEAQTDFIFAVLAEELGFAAVTVMMLAFALFFYRSVRLARRTTDSYAQFVVVGVIVVMFYEMFVNIGMNVGILPVTGITLPFVSYGGSSLLAHCGMVGLLQGIAMHHSRGAGVDPVPQLWI